MTIQSNFPAIRPTLDLNFANAEVLDPRITFTRASTATYYGTRTALAEQNLLLRSQDYSATWTVTNLTPVTGKTAPDGTSTATEFTAGAANAVLTQGFVAVAGSYTFTVFLRRVTGSGDIQIAADNGTWNTKVITGTWARYDITQTVVAGSRTAGIRVVTSGDAIEVWGAQLEQRSTASAYTLTTTQPVNNYIPVLLTAAAGVPRFDHNPVTFESLGLEIEEQRTNLLLQSEDLDTTWSETRATLSLNSVIAPNGTLTADGLIASTDNDTHFTTQTFTGTAAAHTFSVYAKARGLNHVALRLFNGSTQVGLAYYNLSTGATGTVTSGTASIQSVGNGWYRCILTATLAASASCTADIFLANADNTNSFAGNAFDGVSLWGFDVEAGLFATSYIKTEGSQVTRSADIASMTGTNFSSWYNQGEGSFVTEAIANNSATAGAQIRRFLEIRNDAASEIIRFGRGTSNTAIRFLLATNGVAATLTPSGAISFGTIVQNNPDIFSVGYSATIPSLVLDGTKAPDITGGFVGLPTGMTQMNIGSAGVANLTDILNGTIKRVAFYPLRLTNTQLISLTS